jgi:hypothetical protein
MEQLEVLKRVTERLQRLDIAYMISGSVAMSLYAQPRMTRDIDIVITIGSPAIDRFVAAFEADFYADLLEECGA